MALEVCEKQPWEELDFEFDLAAKMAAGATLASITAIIIDPLGTIPSPSLSFSNPTLSGSRMKARYAGGLSGERYRVTFRGVDSNGQKLEHEGVVKVKERQ